MSYVDLYSVPQARSFCSGKQYEPFIFKTKCISLKYLFLKISFYHTQEKEVRLQPFKAEHGSGMAEAAFFVKHQLSFMFLCVLLLCFLGLPAQLFF